MTAHSRNGIRAIVAFVCLTVVLVIATYHLDLLIAVIAFAVARAMDKTFEKEKPQRQEKHE